ncbi:hypothetical protein HDE_10419 [Halotydeus destructor]|nr:hypothetical protein HDE_10419 [Halotydeus destructor]
MSRSVQNAFEQNLIKQSKETAWRNYGKFVNKFDLSVDNIHNLNLKFINVNLSNKFCPRLSDHVIEYTNYVELLQTCGNMELNKVIMVFADLCSQLTDLSEIAYRDFVGPLSLYAENRSDSSNGSEGKKSNEDLTEMSKFIGVLYDMLCFTNRCMTVSQSFVQQIEALFTVYKKTKSNENKGSIDLDNFKLDIVLEHFSRMIVALINIDELISNHSAIQKDFVNYKRMVELASKDVTSFQLDPSETQKVSTLFAMVKVIEKELIDGGTILNRLIDTVTSATQANGPLFTNSQISEQFLNFIKTQIADFEADCLKTADGTKWLSICGLFVIYIWLFKKDDKRMFRNILESQRKTNMLQVHLKGERDCTSGKAALFSLAESNGRQETD